jgi:hypothetical protein
LGRAARPALAGSGLRDFGHDLSDPEPERLMAAGPNPPASGGWEPRAWVVLGRLAPALVAIGVIMTVVGLVAGQAIAVVVINGFVILVGAILMLLLRWRA